MAPLSPLTFEKKRNKKTSDKKNSRGELYRRNVISVDTAKHTHGTGPHVLGECGFWVKSGTAHWDSKAFEMGVGSIVVRPG